jgi:hypothetical protein
MLMRIVQFQRFLQKCERRVNFPLPVTPYRMTIDFFLFFLKFIKILSSTILLVEICLISNTNYDFFPCSFFLFFIFDLVQTARSNEKQHQLFEVSSHEVIFISYLVCVNSFMELKSMTSSGLSSINCVPPWFDLYLFFFLAHSFFRAGKTFWRTGLLAEVLQLEIRVLDFIYPLSVWSGHTVWCSFNW